jgi:putative transposase
MGNNRYILGSRKAINTEKREQGCPGISSKTGRRPPQHGPHRILETIFYVLRTGIKWKAIPKAYGGTSSIYRYFRFWWEQGFFQALWIAGVENYAEAKGINWIWLSAEGCMSKAVLTQEGVGKTPMDSGKNGSKRHLLVDGAGVLVAPGANRYEVSQLEVVMDAFQVERPDRFESPQQVCLDKGYSGEAALEIVVLRGFIPYSKGRG